MPAGSGDPGERLIYGAGPVREVLARRPAQLRAIWVDPKRADKSSGDPVAQIVTAARAASIKVEDRDRQTLDRVAGEGARHQGVIAWLGPFAYANLDAMLTSDGEPALLVALDGVEDPRNLGAILRSAYLLGAGGVIIPEHRAAHVTPLVAKASAGASELVPIAQVGNLVRALEQLRELERLARRRARVATGAADRADRRHDGGRARARLRRRRRARARRQAVRLSRGDPDATQRGRLVQCLGRRGDRALRDAETAHVTIREAADADHTAVARLQVAACACAMS